MVGFVTNVRLCHQCKTVVSSSKDHRIKTLQREYKWWQVCQTDEQRSQTIRNLTGFCHKHKGKGVLRKGLKTN